MQFVQLSRRNVVALLLGGAVASAAPMAARSQARDRMRRIGLLLISGPEPLIFRCSSRPGMN